VKIHLKQIHADGLHIDGAEECPIPELQTDGMRSVGPMRYSIDLGLSGSELWATGSLTQPVEVACVSCLEKFVYDVKVPAFAVHMELHGPETVDLTPFIREDILLNLPAYPHCDREGGRKCRKAEIELTVAEKQDAEAKREHDWEALDKLKLKLRK
jgi:uncharacterized metal-binding protein YceD (DUF177 family)